MNTLFTIGIFLCFFLSVLLFTKRPQALSDKVLGIWLVCIGIYLLNYYLHYLGYWEKYPHLVGATHPFPLVFVAFVTVSVVYIVLAYQKINQYERVIGDNFGYNEGISLQWLRLLLIGFGLIFSVMIVGYIVQFLLEIEIGVNIELIFLTLFVLLIGLIGFWGIRHQGIFSVEKQKPFIKNLVLSDNSHRSDNIEPSSFSKTPEYRKSGLKAEDATSLHQQLLTLMTTEKPYLEPKLSLAQLAEMLGVLPNHLSQIINQYEEKNFYDFVNSYRVEEFITLAKKDIDKNFNLLGLAYEAGFNSKSSFNQVFKKITGKTPSEFLN